VKIPEIRYLKSGDVSIAYSVVGNGPMGLIFAPGFTSNVEYGWEEPGLASFYRSLGSFGRLIVFDKRGTGLSDHMQAGEALETRMDDVRAVMDSAGSERAAIIGFSEGGSMATLFAASHPERTTGLILYGALVAGTWSPETPWAWRREQWDVWLDDDRVVDVQNARYVAERIPGARYVELPGDDHLPWVGDADRIVGEIQTFLESAADRPLDAELTNRVLATVTDIVDSTTKAAELGDRRWGELPAEHHARVRRQLVRFRGRELDTAGDGFFASFDGPARDLVRMRDLGFGPRGRPPNSSRPAHGGVRARRWEGWRHRRSYWSARRCGGRARRGARFRHGEGSRRGVGYRVPRPWEHSAKGLPGEWQLFAVGQLDVAA
jgi:pimeloyl-ACP methyl ester carboxylesterase